MTLRAGAKKTFLLEANQVLVITPSTDIVGEYIRLSNPGAGDPSSPVALSAGKVVTIGPFSTSYMYSINIYAGTCEDVISKSVVSSGISDIKGLDTQLQNGNWQVIAGNVAGDELLSTTNSTTGPIRTARINYISPVDCSHIRLVVGNVSGFPSGVVSNAAETPGPVTRLYRAAAEYTTIGSESSETGDRLGFLFGGQRNGECVPESLLISEPLEFQVQAGVPFLIRLSMNNRGSGYQMPLIYSTAGGSAVGALNNGEGQTNTADAVDVGTVTQQIGSTICPVTILGYVKNAVPSLGIHGDSIVSGVYDIRTMGYAVRAALAQTSQLAFAYPKTPYCPHLRASHTGDQAANFAVWKNSKYRLRLGSMCSTIYNNLGTNDFINGRTAAQIKADLLSIANFYLKRGKRFIQGTVLPRTTSSNSWQTVAGQTVTAQEAIRLVVNAWLRDTSSLGYVAQASAMSGISGQCYVFDCAAVVEVDSTGTFNPIGGFWPGMGASPVATGTITSGSTTQLVNDTGQALTVNQYQGGLLRFTSSNNNNTNCLILSNDTNLFNVTGVTTTPTVGGTYEIYYNTDWTVDGTHPSARGHMLIAQQFPVGLIV